MYIKNWVISTLLFFSLNCFAENKEIAITLDDLPFVGSGSNTPASLKRTQERFRAIINALVEHQVPATGFAIGGAVAKNEWDLMEEFRNQGFSIGNHTYTHRSLQSISSAQYIADIERADAKLAPVMSEPKYFRYPYLAEGNGTKRKKVLAYLAEHQYIVAPVTIDSKDYAFNARLFHVPYSKRMERIQEFKKTYLAYIWKQTIRAEKEAQNTGRSNKQILLLHANLLNSVCLGDIIRLYKSHGYKFITLEEALRKDAEIKDQQSSLPPILLKNSTFYLVPILFNDHASVAVNV